MTKMQNLWHQPWRNTYVQGDAWSWISSIGLSIAVGVAYLLAAHLSLVLLTKPECVAVFWPAAGIASGTLIVLGPKARLPVALAVLSATIAVSVLDARNFPAAIVFAICNAGEALLVAWLITQLFGKDFSLDSLRTCSDFCSSRRRMRDLGNRGDGRVRPLLQLGRANSGHLAELVRL